MVFYWQTTKQDNDQYYKKIFKLQPSANRIEMSNSLLDQFTRAAQQNTSNDIETGALKIDLPRYFVNVLSQAPICGDGSKTK